MVKRKKDSKIAPKCKLKIKCHECKYSKVNSVYHEDSVLRVIYSCENKKFYKVLK